MRHATDWWMFIAAHADPWSKALYDAGRARGQGKYLALRGLDARWVRVIWRCRTDHPLEPARHHPPELTAAARALAGQTPLPTGGALR